MGFVLTQEGGQRLWAYLLGNVTPWLPTLHLLGQAYTPVHDSVLSLFAANEVTGDSGYTPLQLVSPKAWWTITGLPDGAQAEYITLSWTLVAAPTVYGYYLADDAYAVSFGAELFSSPWINPGPPGVIALRLPLSLTSLPASS